MTASAPLGRPLKFEFVEELETQINRIFDDCDRHEDIHRQVWHIITTALSTGIILKVPDLPAVFTGRKNLASGTVNRSDRILKHIGE